MTPPPTPAPETLAVRELHALAAALAGEARPDLRLAADVIRDRADVLAHRLWILEQRATEDSA